MSKAQADVFESNLFQNHAARLTDMLDHYAAEWHRLEPQIPSDVQGLQRIVTEEHLTNFQLWHAEDRARTPGIGDEDLAGVKRFIDKANQRRNDLVEQCDGFLLNLLAPRLLPKESAELHSETPGLMIDRLSILSLKMFHTEEEIHRSDAPAGHAQMNHHRLSILTEQRQDLATALDRLWTGVLAGERRFKVYRQLKMYNDPALNPAVYAARTNS
jgi:hypothetical protein